MSKTAEPRKPEIDLGLAVLEGKGLEVANRQVDEDGDYVVSLRAECRRCGGMAVVSLVWVDGTATGGTVSVGGCACSFVDRALAVLGEKATGADWMAAATGSRQ